MCSFLSTSITQALIGQERYMSLKLIALVLQFTTSQWTSWFYHSPDYFYAFLLREPFSSVRLFYSSTLFCLSFRHLLWHFVLTAVRHSHSYIRCTCSSSFSAAFVSFTVRHSHCVRHTPFIDGVRLHEVRISILLRSCFILQFVVTSFIIKPIPFNICTTCQSNRLWAQGAQSSFVWFITQLFCLIYFVNCLKVSWRHHRTLQAQPVSCWNSKSYQRLLSRNMTAK